MIEILALGIATTMQDRGRLGWAHLGVGRSGAADLRAHDLANRLVGNPPEAATLETSGALQLRVLRPAVLAVAGALIPWTVDGGPPLGNGLAQALPAGAVISGGHPVIGLRAYVAVRGGFDVPPVLGSRSTDTLGAIGPRLDTRLPVGAEPAGAVPTDLVPLHVEGDEAAVVPGPRRDWFDGAAWTALIGTRWRVTPALDRVGVRLAGPPLTRRRDEELPSEGLVVGAIQVPGDGQPIVMLADHPVTGGYPVIAVVERADLWVCAQAVPGGTLRFRGSDG